MRKNNTWSIHHDEHKAVLSEERELISLCEHLHSVYGTGREGEGGIEGKNKGPDQRQGGRTCSLYAYGYMCTFMARYSGGVIKFLYLRKNYSWYHLPPMQITPRNQVNRNDPFFWRMLIVPERDQCTIDAPPHPTTTCSERFHWSAKCYIWATYRLEVWASLCLGEPLRIQMVVLNSYQLCLGQEVVSGLENCASTLIRVCITITPSTMDPDCSFVVD